jgi:hypothetical protein
VILLASLRSKVLLHPESRKTTQYTALSRTFKWIGMAPWTSYRVDGERYSRIHIRGHIFYSYVLSVVRCSFLFRPNHLYRMRRGSRINSICRADLSERMAISHYCSNPHLFRVSNTFRGLSTLSTSEILLSFDHDHHVKLFLHTDLKG